MEIKKIDNLELFEFRNFKKISNLIHCFTTKTGGFSKEQYSSMNLGWNTKESLDVVRKNYEYILNKNFNEKMNSLISLDQVHSDNILIIKKEDSLDDKNTKKTDGVVTNKERIVLSTVYADCVPIFFVDPVNNVIAIAHSGWKGTVKKISKKIIKIMVEEFGSKVQDLKVGIGPSIMKCCYEVKDDLIKAINNDFENIDQFIEKRDKRYYLDLKELNKQVLIETGIKEKNVEISNECTSCLENTFYSYRRDNGDTGRMAGMIMIKSNGG